MRALLSPSCTAPLLLGTGYIGGGVLSSCRSEPAVLHELPGLRRGARSVQNPARVPPQPQPQGQRAAPADGRPKLPGQHAERSGSGDGHGGPGTGRLSPSPSARIAAHMPEKRGACQTQVTALPTAPPPKELESGARLAARTDMAHRISREVVTA